MLPFWIITVLMLKRKKSLGKEAGGTYCVQGKASQMRRGQGDGWENEMFHIEKNQM